MADRLRRRTASSPRRRGRLVASTATSDTRSRPARSGWTSTSTSPAAAGERATARPWAAPISRRATPPGASQRGAPADLAHVVQAVRPGEQGAARLPVATPRVESSVVGDVGRVGDDEVEPARAGRAAGPRTRSPADPHVRPRRPMPARLARATSSASARRVGRPDLDGARAARRPARARSRPSRCRGRRRQRPGAVGRGRRRRAPPRRVLGLRPGDQHPPVDEQIERRGTARGRARTAAAPRRRGGRPWRRGGRPPAWSPARRARAATRRPPARWPPGTASGPRSGRRAGSVGLDPQRPPGDRVAAPAAAHAGRQAEVGPRRRLSWRARSSAMSASTTSSRSPASTSCKPVERQPDAVVADPVLLEVVGADLLAAAAAADLRPALGGQLGRLARPARPAAGGPAAPAWPGPGSAAGCARPAWRRRCRSACG